MRSRNQVTPSSVLRWRDVDHEEFLEQMLPAMDMVHNIARRAVQDPEDARDLVQDTYLAAFRAWTEHRRPRRVEPWLATICLNLARDRYRTKRRHGDEVPLGELTSLPAPPEWGPEERALGALDGARVRRAMWALPEEQRIAIALVDLADLPITEAARVMSTPRGTVLSRLHRGRRSLARLLGAGIEETQA
jgi:RNA polymerase sigma-70 factor (ECF subfamily)